MDEKKITCIICPSSCCITVKGSGDKVESVDGYGCKRGLEYAEAEYLHPERTLTAVIKANQFKTPVVSVRTSKPIPKDMQAACMEVIRTLEADPPYTIGKVVCSNILGTGADIILTNE